MFYPGLPGRGMIFIFRKGNKMLRKIGLVVGILLVTASYAAAGNVQTFGIGSAATAQGEAVSAYSNDPFAVYYNPAGLVLTKRSTISTGFMGYSPNIEIENFKAVSADGTDQNAAAGYASDIEIKNSDLAIPHIGYAMPINDKLYFGIAAYNPYGLHVEWDKNPVRNPGAAYAWESYYGSMVVIPSLEYKISDKLSVGFGVSLGESVSEAGKTFTRSAKTISKANAAAGEYTNLANDANLSAAEAVGNAAGAATPEEAYAYMVQAGVATQAAASFTDAATKAAGAAALYTTLNGSTLKLEAKDNFNYSFNAGVMYQPVDILSFGLTYRGRTKTKFKGDTIVKGATSLADGSTINLNGSVDMEYDHPESIQGGVRYFASKTLSVEFDMTWTRWSILEEQIENVVLKDIPVLGNVPLSFNHTRNWGDTIQYKIGAEWNVLGNLALRGGYTYDPTPIPDDTFDMGWPDTDRSVFNVGCGWGITENWVLDSVVQYVVSTPTRKVRGESSEYNDEYSSVYGETVTVSLDDKGTLWGLGLTLSYMF